MLIISMINYRLLILIPECFTRYHHNYLVHDQTSRRQYYAGVPDIIQVAKHYFIEAQLLELIAVGKVFGW